MFQIPRHPIRATDVDFLCAVVREIKNTAVFEKSADNASDINILGKTGNTGTQHADATYNQIDFHTCSRRLIQFVDDLPIGETIYLRHNMCRSTCSLVVYLSINKRVKLFTQINGSDHQFSVFRL